VRVSDPDRAAGLVSPAAHPYLRVPRPFVLAHRGLALAAPENSMPAFEAAVRAGATHLETDVHATADGVLVVFHDDRLDRLTELAGPVAGVRWADLRAAGLRGGTPVPLLADVLAAWPRLRVNVDLKADGAVGPFVDLVRSTGAGDRVCTASFSERRRRAAVRGLAGCGPLAHSLGFSASARFVGLAAAGAPVWALRRALGGALALQLPDRTAGVPVVTGRLVRAAHAVGAQVHVWTVDEPARMRELLAVGADAIVTNRADLALPLTAAAGGAGPRSHADVDSDAGDDSERW
jgi:glycerophosphoryl diester phosphodiesterase